MLAKKRLNAKLVMTKLKYGWDAAKFSEYLNCSEEEFLAGLEKIFESRALHSIKRGLDENKMKKEKYLKKALKKEKDSIEMKETTEMSEKNAEIETILSVEAEEAQNTAVEEISSEAETVAKKQSSEELLMELRRKEKELLAVICEADARNVHLRAKRKKINSILSRKRDKLVAMREEVTKIASEVEEAVNTLSEISSLIENEKIKISDNREELKKIREDIENLKKVIIFVYEDGNLEVDGPKELIVPSNWVEIKAELEEDELVDNFTVKQLKSLAKVLALVSNLDNFEVTFEVEAVNEVFEKYRNRSTDIMQ